MTYKPPNPDERGDGAGLSVEEVSTAWNHAVRRIVCAPAKRILVMGPADAGKSTFCRLLVAEAHEAGRHVELLDADLGQKMVGPPACVTLGLATSGGVIELRRLAFVGTADPVKGWRRLIDGIARLGPAADADLLVVNTGGLLSGPGARLKMHKIEALAPDLIVAVGDHPALDEVVGRRGGPPAVRLPVSPHARRKTEGERRAARREAFRRSFAGAADIAFPLTSLIMDKPPDASGCRPPAGLLVGLADPSGEDLGVGIVTHSDAPAGIVTCRTSVSSVHVGWMRWGSLRLSDDFSEAAVPSGPAR